MRSMVELSHEFLLPALHGGALCVDATLGNGKDTMFFLKQDVHQVIAFEIQKDVLKKTVQKIQDPRLQAHCIGHQDMEQYIDKPVDAMIFNFGYCPGEDPTIQTQPDTSLTAIQKGLRSLKTKGRMSLVFYPHEQGKIEAHVIEKWVCSLDPSLYSVIKVSSLLKDFSPYFVGIEKRHV